jgi:cation diffusion facilitator family transporter
LGRAPRSSAVASTKRVVYAALVANGAIAILKFGAFALTGSSSMLSEAYHSVSDTGNQVLLLLGIRMSEKGASPSHPFGRGKEQYFYAFVVAVILFGVAGFASLTEGLDHLGSPYHGKDITVNYAVLGGAFLFELYALGKAWQGLRREMAEKGYDRIREAYRRSKDATLLTALTEDTVALLGIVTAMIAIGLSELYHTSFYDAVGSMVIGLLLMGFALVLAWENRGLIVGEGVTREDRAALLDAIQSVDAVERVVDLRTLYLGAENLLVATEVTFRDGLSTTELEDAIDAVERAIEGEVADASKIFVEPEDREGGGDDGGGDE